MEKELPGRPPPPASNTNACQLLRIPPCLTPWRYKNVSEERLYIKYTNRQRARAIPRLLILGLLLQIYVAIVPGGTDINYAYVSHTVWILVNFILAGLHTILRRSRPILNHIALLVVWMQLLDCVARRFHESYNELLGWAVVLQYFTFATLPFHHITLLLYSISFSLFYLLVQYMNVWKSGKRSPDDFHYQQTSNALLLICGSVMGCIAFVISEAQQRASFHRTKTSLLDKVTIEQQSKEQERLLLSVLPKHVAVKMRQDLGVIDEQFKKIYMSRHENVSILYADIVGFTAISSTYSAQDLVAILNELFARFDRLSEKYKQLRIKILGDCYYCISGAPIERWDHAILSVHMGLSMVKAIKYVQQITSSPVDMRVGIHTGAVLAGVLGQRQWQFDVYSRDVELANKMESSGMAGRVHVSEVTLKFLKDSFEVEPAYGERREEMLRQAGIKTYFIVKVLKPYQSEERSAPAGEPGEEGEGGDDDDRLSELKDDDEDSVLSPQEETQDSDDMKILAMLQEELVKRDDDRELADATTACLTFKNAEAEFCYARRSYPCPLLVVVPPLILLAPIVAVSTFAVPPSWAINAVYLALIVEVGVVNILYYSVLKIGRIKEWVVKPRYKIAFGVFNMAMFISANIVPLIICGEYEKALDDGLNSDAISHSGARRCSHASYYYHVGAGAACGVLWIYPISFVYRSLMVLLVAVAHSIPAILYPALLRPQPTLNYTMHFDHPFLDIWAPQIYSTRNLIMLFFIALVLIIFNRYTESLERALHSRGERMRVQAEQASDLRRRNQALIHNVLPPHVATHFMGARHNHRDLYSQSYAEVGVLFASMPNFSEFYSEESVNNQGLECLRFLNEVISDFDMLLEDAKYCKDIIKIKTISSTYMAASGLDPARQMLPSDSITVRWAHLACLVEFALELQRVLSAINEQSFNHFVLRIGINHGPITAGVIGARKPHYDIWGNTVNVASRMESTGKVDCIQVTEETSQILRNFGFDFEQRGWVAVKGKGELMTYYLIGKKECNSSTKQPSNNQHESSTQLPNGDASDSNSPLLKKSSF